MEKYKAAAYMRISNDDGDKQESQSIASQRTIIESYVNKNPDIKLVDEFVDDGYTGTNFNRPSFKKLIQAIEDGRINCVIVKDLSRFGRDYIEVGQYLERYFPVNDVRFVAINDGYDSQNSNASDEFILPIRNVMNAHYSKDISKKVRTAFRAKQSQGEFVGAFASYGYKKHPNDKHKLIVDDDAAEVVRRIFNMYNSGKGKLSIAKILNDERIPCPSEYKKLKGLNYKNAHRLNYTSYWTYSTIARLLENEMYVGSMVQNKSIRKMIRGRATKLEEAQWIVVKGTHEPIIDKEVWDVTQELLTKRTRQLDFDSEIGLFSGYIRCGDCGRAFSKIRRRNNLFYVCGTYKRYSKNICPSHEVREDVLEQLLLDKLNEELMKLEEIIVPENTARKSKADKQPYLIRLEKIYKLKKELYEDLKQGLLTKEEYNAYKSDYLREEELIQGQLNSLENQNTLDNEKNEWIENLQKYRKLDKLDRETLACILDSITVYENEKEKIVDIKLKYAL